MNIDEYELYTRPHRLFGEPVHKFIGKIIQPLLDRADYISYDPGSRQDFHDDNIITSFTLGIKAIAIYVSSEKLMVCESERNNLAIVLNEPIENYNLLILYVEATLESASPRSTQ